MSLVYSVKLRIGPAQSSEDFWLRSSSSRNVRGRTSGLLTQEKGRVVTRDPGVLEHDVVFAATADLDLCLQDHFLDHGARSVVEVRQVLGLVLLRPEKTEAS